MRNESETVKALFAGDTCKPENDIGAVRADRNQFERASGNATDGELLLFLQHRGHSAGDATSAPPRFLQTATAEAEKDSACTADGLRASLRLFKRLHLHSDQPREALLAASAHLESDVFPQYEVLTVHEEEAYAANCLYVNGVVLVSEGFPRTKALLERAGREVVTVPTTEFRKGGGSLTCLSVLF